MQSDNTRTPSTPLPANGSKDESAAKGQAGKTASNAKPSSKRSAQQGEKKTTIGK
jgi:hypothetical protein